ncbi:MAG: hypothetical protein ACJASL_002841 [Paraglaciecola sp.]|jgi:hypothetical protein
MNIKMITFEIIRCTSLAAILAVASYGFFTPISVAQGLIYNPMLLIGLLSVAGYVSGRLNGMKPTADIHRLAFNNQLNPLTINKAA